MRRPVSLRTMAGGGFMLVVLGNVPVDPIWEMQVCVDVAGIRIVGIRADRKALLTLPGENLVAPWWAVIARLDLRVQTARVGF